MAARATKNSELQAQVLNARKRLRNLTGALEAAQSELLTAINDGLQLKLDFPMSDTEEDEVAKAKEEKEKQATCQR